MRPAFFRQQASCVNEAYASRPIASYMISAMPSFASSHAQPRRCTIRMSIHERPPSFCIPPTFQPSRSSQARATLHVQHLNYFLTHSQRSEADCYLGWQVPHRAPNVAIASYRPRRHSPKITATSKFDAAGHPGTDLCDRSDPFVLPLTICRVGSPLDQRSKHQ